MEHFTGGTISSQPARRLSTLGGKWDARVRDLVRDFGAEQAPELIEEMIVTALKMARDGMGVADLKLISRSMKELRYAAKVFSNYRAYRKIAVFGSARAAEDSANAKLAEEFGLRAVLENFMIITGGGDGIMGAAQRGAGRDMSFGLNIRLPFEQRANETIYGDKKLINFNYFFTRKLNFVKETHAMALFPGGFGTLDETFEVLTLMQTGKARIMPVVMLEEAGGTYWPTWLAFVRAQLLKLGLVGADDFDFFKISRTVDEALAEITGFYRIYQSSRWVGEKLVLRLAQPLARGTVAKLNEQFSDVLRQGRIVQSAALPAESNEPEIGHLPRLVFTPHRHNFGRLRQLIDAINRL